MTIQVQHHPAIEQLEKFNQGLLTTGVSVAISAHLEFCAQCKQEMLAIEAKVADEWFAEAGSQEPEVELRHMLDDIIGQPQIDEETINTKFDAVAEVHMLDHSAVFPKVLAKAASGGLLWKKLPGGINQASMALDNETQCDVLYMKPGSQIPLHTHQGSEITLVLDGSFSDELGHYHVGDFIRRDSNQNHTPVSEEGCLCFTVLDSPVIFTTGFARLLNPINRYLFNKNLNRL